VTHRDEHLSAERIQAFLDGELSQAEMARVQGHSASCVRCQSEIEAWRLLFDELEDLPLLDPSPALVDRVMRALPRRAAAGLAEALDVRRPASEHLGGDRIQDLLDGSLGQAAALEAHAHLAGCPTCQTELVQWQAVFARLEDLDELAPSYGFAEAVMGEVGQRAPVGLLAWFRDRSTRPRDHLSPERIQDLLDGSLGGRGQRRAEGHLAACGSCQQTLESWQGVFSELETLAELAPSEGFSERVMARVRVRAPVPTVRVPLAARIRAISAAAVPSELLASASVWARRFMPQRGRTWAFVASIAAAPTLLLAGAAVYLFSNPLLTPGYLASYLWWRVSGAASGVLAQAGALAVQTADVLRSNAAVDAVAGSAGALMLAGIVFTALMGLSLLVVYRNLLAPSVNARYAQITS
jgi:anti-sigma factor RsiW